VSVTIPISLPSISTHHTPSTSTSSPSLHDALPICRAGQGGELMTTDLETFLAQPGRDEQIAEIRRRIDDGGITYIYLQFGSHKRSEEHTSELQSLTNIVCRLLLEKKKRWYYVTVV